MMPFYSETIGLIGIDTGHNTTVAKVSGGAAESETELKVRLNTGVAVVAPVWKIEELLVSGELRNQPSRT